MNPICQKRPSVQLDFLYEKLSRICAPDEIYVDERLVFRTFTLIDLILIVFHFDMNDDYRGSPFVALAFATTELLTCLPKVPLEGRGYENAFHCSSQHLPGSLYFFPVRAYYTPNFKNG